MKIETLSEYNDYLSHAIAEQAEIITKAKEKAIYFSSCKKLLNLMLTAEVIIHHALQGVYGCEKKLVFEETDVKEMNLRTVNRRISLYKSMSVDSNEPSWASNARRCAKIIEAYENK